MRDVAVGTPEPEDCGNFVKENKRPKPWDTDKLPWGLPKQDPDIAGRIIQIQQSQEPPEYPHLIIEFMNWLAKLIWFIPNDTMRREEERRQITTVRVRTSDGEKRDARLIGLLRGAPFTLGDDIWFWGWHHKGNFIIRRGYNWTSKTIVAPSRFMGWASLPIVIRRLLSPLCKKF